jgi:AraC-like DNA-binding protein
MDPLSDVLSLLRIRSYRCAGIDAGGDWSFRLGAHEGIKFHAIVSGDCWLSVAGVPNDMHLESGDCFVLAGGRSFRLASDLAVMSLDARSILPTLQDGMVSAYNGGGKCSIVCGHFAFDSPQSSILARLLPPVVLIRNDSDKALLRWSLDRMSKELRERLPGGFLVAQQLATMILVEVLRSYLAGELEGEGGIGWLFALADKQIGKAVYAIHESPERRWTLQTLAEHIGMSRTTFTLRFKAKAGVSPIEYLTRWRMMVAGDRLTKSDNSVAAIALSVGYDSESSFSTAFKRVMGCSPRQYRKSPQHGRAAVQARELFS